MLAEPIRPADLGPLRAQDTLERLIVDDTTLVTPSRTRRYDIRDGLVFMSYPVTDESMILETMEEERTWQGTPVHVRRDEDFLRVSAPRAVQFINAIRWLTGYGAGLKAVELGSGSGWVSWLMARAGFDVWMTDFEANSLFSGWIYQHETLRPGRRVVADARYAPFADGFFDVVLLKEFAHHVENRRLLFAEANRILRPGGLVAIMDPATSVWSWIYGLRHSDTHKGHHFGWVDSYLLQLRAQGFRRRWLSFTYPGPPRRRAVRYLQQAAARNVEPLRHNRSVYTAVHARLLGTGGFVYIGEKVGEAARAPRPEMRPIPTSMLVLREEDLPAWDGCRRLVEQAAEQLT